LVGLSVNVLADTHCIVITPLDDMAETTLDYFTRKTGILKVEVDDEEEVEE